jgi:hypothetical protein
MQFRNGVDLLGLSREWGLNKILNIPADSRIMFPGESGIYVSIVFVKFFLG